MSVKKYKNELDDHYFLGVVEDINDPKRMGRVRVRVERLHGRLNDKSFITTEDLPWCDVFFRGNVFAMPPVGKVVGVYYDNSDTYRGTINVIPHFDINLQRKAESLTEGEYESFYAPFFTSEHQYFKQDGKGLMFDYKKSYTNYKENGDITVGLRDNSSRISMGSPDAEQQALFGTRWIEWYDQLVEILLSGAFIGNLSAPVIPSPLLLTHLNLYKSMKESFLSRHLYFNDNFKVKANDRGFDQIQRGDNYSDESFNFTTQPNVQEYQPQERPISGGNPADNNCPPDNFSKNLASSKPPVDATPNEKLRTVNPIDGFENGEIPTDRLTISQKLLDSFPDEDDERKFLLDEVAKALDSLLDYYQTDKKENWNDIIATKGYQSIERQENIRKQNPISAPLAGKDPFGYANQFELFWGISRTDQELTSEIRRFLRGSRVLDESKDNSEELEILDWLLKNAPNYNLDLVGRTSSGEQQWWHWIYKP